MNEVCLSKERHFCEKGVEKMRIADIVIRTFAGLFLCISLPGLVSLIKEDIKTCRELREKGLL